MIHSKPLTYQRRHGQIELAKAIRMTCQNESSPPSSPLDSKYAQLSLGQTVWLELSDPWHLTSILGFLILFGVHFMDSPIEHVPTRPEALPTFIVIGVFACLRWISWIIVESHSSTLDRFIREMRLSRQSIQDLLLTPISASDFTRRHQRLMMTRINVRAALWFFAAVLFAFLMRSSSWNFMSFGSMFAFYLCGSMLIQCLRPRTSSLLYSYKTLTRLFLASPDREFEMKQLMDVKDDGFEMPWVGPVFFIMILIFIGMFAQSIKSDAVFGGVLYTGAFGIGILRGVVLGYYRNERAAIYSRASELAVESALDSIREELES